MLKRLSMKVLSNNTMWITSSLRSRLAQSSISNSSLWDPPFPISHFPVLSACKILWSRCWIPSCWTGFHVGFSPTTPEGSILLVTKERGLGASTVALTCPELVPVLLFPTLISLRLMREEASQPKMGCQ